ncbi:hypothetical protein EVG20_g5072 [Dentipellis fragilis]|uniref:Uncharacterized protein n=1 Tax=Dentipellis fragilis TaxID=205917 RepID=A0A4Y9YWP3_9AGAM|nr:hypothetical protein EVG20_g5072 [Dentipellis fragilis]
MDALFKQLGSAIGVSPDQLKLITCLLVSYPLGSVFIRIPASRPSLKHLFNISITLLYFVPILNLEFALLQLLGDVLATYAVTKTVKGPRMPWIVFTIVTGHLMINHIIRAVSDVSYETFEITGPQMVLTMKLTTFAWNVYDGSRPVEDLDKWQLEKRVAKFPSLLEFLGYAFYFPGVLVGPSLEFSDYMSLVDESIFKTPAHTEQERARQRAVPAGRKRVAYRKGLFGLIYLGLFATFSPSFYYSITITDWFLKQSLLYRIIYLQACGFFERAKYYGIWTLTEGASILTGLGFTGYGPSGESRWEGAANVNVSLIEFAPNFKVLLDSWNMKTNVWLRECIYKRVTPKGKKPGFRSSMTTFAISAFWHGIAPGYYLTFICGGFIQTAGRLCRANLRPLFLPVTPASTGDPSKSPQPIPQTALKTAYDIAGIIASIMVLNYAAPPFMILTFKDSINAWRALGWYGHWMIGLCLLFFYGGGRSLLKGIQAKRLKDAGVALPEKGSVSKEDRSPAPTLPPVDSGVQHVEKKLA